MRPITMLQILDSSPRTLQRWGWEREGSSVVLGGMILFLGTFPGRGLRLRVELLDQAGVLIGTSIARLDPLNRDWMPVSSFRAEFVTGAEPPYRLRVQFISDGMPIPREELMKAVEAQIRPWKRRELPSSS